MSDEHEYREMCSGNDDDDGDNNMTSREVTILAIGIRDNLSFNRQMANAVSSLYLFIYRG